MTNLETYLVQLQSALGGMTIAERQDIVEEIRMHVRERIETSGLTEAETLERLGPAVDLARDYSSGALVRKASTAFSPWLILRGAYAWARLGVNGVGVFFAAVVGYALGGGFVLLALIKPFFPKETGFWVGPGVFDFGFMPGNTPEAREYLGIWLIPVCCILGGLFLALTTLTMRWLMSKFRQSKTAALELRAS